MTSGDRTSRTQGESLLRLSDINGAGLILQTASGVWYVNQAGGHSCMQPEVQGVFVPLEAMSVGQGGMPLDHSLAEVEWPSVALKRGMTPAEADAVDEALKTHGVGEIAVDRSRLLESMEAWVFVTVASERGPGLHMIETWAEALGAVLVWPNSD